MSGAVIVTMSMTDLPEPLDVMWERIEPLLLDLKEIRAFISSGYRQRRVGYSGGRHLAPWGVQAPRL